MSNSLIFKNENLGEVRVAFIDNEPLFCLSDVCKILELSNSRMVAEAIKNEFEGCKLDSHPFETAGGIQHLTIITEPQLYFVLMRSNKAEAKEFRKWVNTEVLPSIRKTGAYSIQQQIPKTYGEALLEAGRLAIENERLLTQAKENQPKIEAFDELMSIIDDFIERVNKTLEKLIENGSIYQKGSK